jgi:asparagine synthetase B (glutamine-hydrolysing)
MSDFVFSTNAKPHGELSRAIQSIYREDAPEIREFHGPWGALAVSRTLYQGFAPIETERFICLVIGGPVLTYTDNRFLVGDDPTAGTEQVLARWRSAAGIRWDEDLSGPFVAVRIDKRDSRLEVITDLMSFITVFEAECGGEKTIGTHVDAVARAAGCTEAKDATSIADFILHGVVTYPFTLYKPIRQLAPGSVHQWSLSPQNNPHEAMAYWQPVEDNPYQSMDDAADALREGLHDYVQMVTSGMPRVALFLSGGEDSRCILSLLPARCQRDAFIFVESMNREARVAKKVAAVYGIKLNIGQISPSRYLDVLPACADLVGSGSQCNQVHSYGFHNYFDFAQYPAVFGGLFADSLLKGLWARKIKGYGPLPFLPQIARRGGWFLKPVKSDVFDVHMLGELNERRTEQYNRVRRMRPQSTDEWCEIWPFSARWGIASHHGHRRLFRSYEPFLANKSVKLSAQIPLSWKFNRRLYHRATKPLLQPVKHLPHSDGWLPYYPWYLNCFIHFMTWARRKAQVKTGAIKGNQGSWADLKALSHGEAWRDAIAVYSTSVYLSDGLSAIHARQLLEGDQLNTTQKLNLLQVLYSLKNGAAALC